MRNFSKKTISLVLIFTLLIAIFAPTMVSALSYDLTDGTTINSYNVTSDVVTLYVGNVSVDGTSKIKYLYTDKSVNVETLNEMEKILTGDYATMLPTTAGQVKVSNDSSLTVNDVFTDAGLVAANLYPDGTVSDTSSTILYNQTQFNSLVTASQTEVSDEKTAEQNNLDDYNERKRAFEAVEQEKVVTNPSYEPQEFTEEYVSYFKDSTTYPNSADKYFIADNSEYGKASYAVVNSKITRITPYNINRTIIKVVNTSANVTSPVATATPITSVNVTLTAPKVGNKVLPQGWTGTDTENIIDDGTMEPDNYPSATSSTAHVTVDSAYWINGTYVDRPDDWELLFFGTFKEDTYYYAYIDISAETGYTLDNDLTIKVNGETPAEVFAVYNNENTHFVAKIKATTETPSIPTTYEYIDNTANQKYTINENDTLTFRINADYSLFENGGKVYVDDELVSSANYTSKSGSTIITFTKDYMSSLSEGEHTLKVAFNNGGSATTKFTVAKANTTTPEETTPTTTTETTTTTSNNPKTGDNIITIFSIFAIATLGAFTTIKLNKNRKVRKH